MKSQIADTGTYWLSRQPKYTGDELFTKAREHLRSCDFTTTLRLLRMAAQLGHEDATWLLQFLLGRGVENGRPNEFMTIRDWAYWMFSNTTDPRARDYRLSFSELTRNNDLQEVQESAEASDAMAQFLLGRYYDYHIQVEETLLWYRKAVAQNYPEAFYALACTWRGDRNDTKSDYLGMVIKGARLGDQNAMSYLVAISDNRRDELEAQGVSDMETLGYSVQLAIEVSGNVKALAKFIDDNFSNLEANPDPQEISTSYTRLFIIGQLYADSEVAYPPWCTDPTVIRAIGKAVQLYRQMTSGARNSTVYAMLVLRRLGVVKDIAKLIGRLVYASREDVAWYSRTA